MGRQVEGAIGAARGSLNVCVLRCLFRLRLGGRRDLPMPPTPDGMRDPFVSQCRNASYTVGTEQDSDGGEAVQCAITEATLRERIGAGGTILDAISVIRDQPGYPRLFLLFLRTSWADGYFVVALHRARAFRGHKSADPWLAFLEALGYRGPLTLIRDDDERIARLGLPGLDK